MFDAERMKLVFRLGGSGFSLPVDHLVEILQGAREWLDRSEADDAQGLLGHVAQRGGRMPVYSLGRRLGLETPSAQPDLSLLVLSGHNGHWGLPVDAVDGIYPAESFSYLPLPELLLAPLGHLYQGLDLWQGELLVAGDAGLWDASQW